MFKNCDKKFSQIFLLLSGLWVGSNALALPFPELDARSAAMGGVGIAHGIRNAAYYNPGLAALEAESYDAFFVIPGLGEFESDPDNVEGGLASGDIAGINNKVYQKYEYDLVQLTIPTPFLGGAAYIADYTYHTAKVENNTDLIHRSIDLFEIGVSAAQLQDVLWARNVLVGLTLKFMLFESYGYQENAALADLNLDNDQLKRNSMLNLDFGMSKEYGVWKTGFVVKNLLARKRDYGFSGESFKIEPQIRAGLAYQSRRAVLEFDLDLVKNEEVGFGSETMLASIGWEWSIFRAFDLRLGYQQNLVDNKNARISGGLGLRLWSILLDFSASVDADGSGSYAQLSWEF